MITEKTEFYRTIDTVIDVINALLSSLFRIYKKQLVQKIISIPIFALLFSINSCTNSNSNIGKDNDSLSIDSAKAENRIHQTIYGINVDSLDHEKYSVRQGENLSDILARYNVDNRHIAKCDSAISKVFDIKKLRAGNNYSVVT